MVGSLSVSLEEEFEGCQITEILPQSLAVEQYSIETLVASSEHVQTSWLVCLRAYSISP